MVKKCHFPDCNYKRSSKLENRSLFLLPSDPDKRDQLIHQLDLPEGFVINLSTSLICSEHFAEGSLVVSGGKLVLGENPTIKGREHDRKINDKIGTNPEFIALYQAVVGTLVEGFRWKTLTDGENTFICFYIDPFDIDGGLSIVKNLIVNADMSYRVIVDGNYTLSDWIN